MNANIESTCGKHLVLIGYRGSGKSTVGKDLARNLGLDFLDTDNVIQEKTGRTIREIFATSGEPAFRDLESEALEQLLSQEDLAPSVIATGGGIVMREENRECLKKLGLVIWLEVSPITALQRISQDTFTTEQRPSLSDDSLSDEVHRMIAQRTPIYEALANIRITNDDNHMATEAVVKTTIEQLRTSSWYSDLIKQLDS